MKVLIIIIILLFILKKKKNSNFSSIKSNEKIKEQKIKEILDNVKFINTNESIPKVIHKIYIDSTMTLNNIDPNINFLFEKIKAFNPGYILKIWSGNDCRKYLKDNFPTQVLQCFDSLKPYAFKADFVRYCILYNEGGWYSDLKEDPLVSFNDINNNNYSFIGIVDLGIQYCLDNFCLQNAFFACIPKHPLLKNCMESVINNCKNKFYGNYNLEPTGPRLFGKEFEKISTLPSNILMGYFIHDIPGGSHYINNKKIMIHKCSNCIQGNDWKHGNNWQKMWMEKNIYN